MIYSFRDALEMQSALYSEGVRYGHPLPTYRQLALTYQTELGLFTNVMGPSWSVLPQVNSHNGPDVAQARVQAGRVLAALLSMHIERLGEPQNAEMDGLDRSIVDIQPPPAPSVEVGLYELHKKGVNVGLQAGIWGLAKVLLMLNMRLDTLLAEYEHHATKQAALYRTLPRRG